MKFTSIVIACVAILPDASVDATKFSRRRTLKNNNEKKNEDAAADRPKRTNLRTSRVSHLRMLEEEGSSMPSIVQASMPIEEAEFSMSIEEAEFSMPAIEEAEMSVSIAIEEAEFSMPAIEEAEFSMPAIEEAEMSVSIQIEEAEFSMPAIEEAEISMPAIEVEPPTMPPVQFLVPLGWSNDGLGLEIPDEEESDMSMSVPLVDAEFSMPIRRRLTESMPLVESDFSMRRLSESMPLVEADFSMPAEVEEGPKSKSRKLGNFGHRSLEEGSVPLVEADFSLAGVEEPEGPKSKSRKLRRKEMFSRRFLEEGSVPLEAAEFQGPEGPIFGGKSRKLAARQLDEDMSLPSLEGARFSIP